MKTKSIFVSALATERDPNKKNLSGAIDAAVNGFKEGDVKSVQVTGAETRMDGSGHAVVVISFEPKSTVKTKTSK